MEIENCWTFWKSKPKPHTKRPFIKQNRVHVKTSNNKIKTIIGGELNPNILVLLGFKSFCRGLFFIFVSLIKM